MWKDEMHCAGVSGQSQSGQPVVVLAFCSCNGWNGCLIMLRGGWGWGIPYCHAL